MKTHVLTVSRVFPSTHKRKGHLTYFPQKILANEGILPVSDAFTEWDISGFEPKIHTIRANYEFWAKRIKEVQEDKAILSIRYWSGKPYNTKQIEICQLDKDSGIGIQKIGFSSGKIDYLYIDYDKISELNIVEIAKNDGLSYYDFYNWFKNYDLSKPMAMIHFTKFRY